jgi:hypothetical protein
VRPGVRMSMEVGWVTLTQQAEGEATRSGDPDPAVITRCDLSEVHNEE